MFVFRQLLFAIAQIIDYLLYAYMWVIIIRALISWVNADPWNPIVRFLYQVTEPVLRPIRRMLPMTGDAFLEEVADDWEELVRENNLLKDQLATLEEQKKATDEQNKSLQQTLIVAQKMAEEFRESSRRAADIVLREAQLQAGKLLEESRP